MRKKGLAVCLSIVSVLIILSCAGSGLAENGDELHLYQGIPFEGTTREVVEHILLEETSPLFEVLTNGVWGDDSKIGIADFGYEWNLQVDFRGKVGIGRILLSSAQSARVAPEEFYESRLQSDLLQFIDVEGQLTDLYGEPDYRFFFTTNMKKYMFESGTWDIEQMMSVCEEYGEFHSWSYWGNVVLGTWIDSVSSRYADKPLSRVMLYYHPDMATIPASITQFPPTNGD